MTRIETQEKELALPRERRNRSLAPLEPETGDVSVVVEDSRLCESFVLPAASEQALQVFHHPYAYAGNVPAQTLDEPANVA